MHRVLAPFCLPKHSAHVPSVWKSQRRTTSKLAQCQRPPVESVRCLRPSQGSITTHTNTLAPVSVGAPRSKAKHVLVRQRLSPEARCQVAASCRQLQGRTGACRAPLRAVSRSVGASLCVVMLRKGGARERTRERWFVGGHGELKHFPQFLDSDGVNLLSLGSPRAPCAYGIALRHFFAAAVEAKSDGPCFSDCMLRRVSAPDQRSQYLGVCCPYSWIYFMGWE